MAVQIEILSLSPERANLALYYPVPVGQQIAAAVNQTREAAGVRLSAQELQDLKDGKLAELVKTVSISGMSKVEAKARIEASWGERQAEARAAYATMFRDADLVGKAFDGTSWS